MKCCYDIMCLAKCKFSALQAVGLSMSVSMSATTVYRVFHIADSRSIQSPKPPANNDCHWEKHQPLPWNTTMTESGFLAAFERSNKGKILVHQRMKFSDDVFDVSVRLSVQCYVTIALFLKLWHKHWHRLKDELFRFGWSEVKGQSGADFWP